MTTSRRRRMLIIGVLGALFALGGGCLAYLATASPETSNVSSGAGGTSSAGGSSGGTGAPPDGSAGNDGDTAPPKPGRSLSVNGPALDGRGRTECIQVIKSNAQVPVRVASAVVSSNDVDVVKQGDCQSGNGPRCDGARLAAGAGCTVGVRLTEDRPSDYYSVTVKLTLNAICTNARLTPCDEAKVAALAPSAANPVSVAWEGSLTDNVYLFGSDDSESPPADERPTPDPQNTPDTANTPDNRSTPEPASSGPSS
jgi:hypothetical protein